MLTCKGGYTVAKRTYWDLTNGRRSDVRREAVLAGGGTATYVRMPSGVMLFWGPVIGLLYAILMPFVGIATVATLAGREILVSVYHVAEKSVSFGWRPSNAYL